jgi:hypothetical protein
MQYRINASLDLANCMQLSSVLSTSADPADDVITERIEAGHRSPSGRPGSFGITCMSRGGSCRRSPMAQAYAITDLAEARNYQHTLYSDRG